MSTEPTHPTVHVIGAGLAGSEAAWQLAEGGIAVILHEMRPAVSTPAHVTGGFAELVCSNSMRSDDAAVSAVGLLHEEMRRAGSLILRCADANRVPAGGALAVDRESFSHDVQAALESHPNVTIRYEEVTKLPQKEDGLSIIASGPLTSPALSSAIQAASGADALSFFDAIAPVIVKDSIDFTKAWFQSRYDRGDGKDYINCPLNEAEYHAFVAALLSAEYVEFKDWEKNTPYFEGCLPVEVMAERGAMTLAFGPMKPVGLTNPNAPETKSFAVVQLRQDNALGTIYNMVGFQTKLKHGEQERIFRTIPGLENAEFARLGGIHRNTFLNSPKVLDETLRLKTQPHMRFAGQITGCEGYVESAAVGLMSGLFTLWQAQGRPLLPPPTTTALGAMLNHITGGADSTTYQPMNITFGLFPELPLVEPVKPGGKPRKLKGADRKRAQSTRALATLEGWLQSIR
ncbi:MAG: methylenetetrahydrofolate--tRNA-(uracil(54)-C(5))-methyltransferase (FADH(2)-oxidizing) TrmFO [Rhodospirillaceae bacterium]|nr:methylenetetrahydrofolate--tRNA-(uracil(54)-C(5))-methyltransferase (FADH(2)-oxidizing) TrmFO [Rhodospirillaceae bacterium]